MTKFVSGESDLVVKECRISMLIKEKNISHLMIQAQQIEEENLKKRATESGDDDFSHSRSGGHGRPRFWQKFSDHDSSIASI